MQLYNEKEQARQLEIQNVQYEEKGSTRKCNGSKSCAQGDKRFYKKLHANRIKGVETSGQYFIQLNFQLLERIKEQLQQ